MPDTNTDRNVLFGMLALQMEFINREQMVAAMHAWVLDKSKSLGQILVDKGSLDAERLETLDALLEEHIKQHGDDPEKSLAALGAIGAAVENPLTELGDDELSRSITASQASISLSLLQRVKAQDADAWERLVYLYGPVVETWCRREGLNQDETEDAGQEVFRAVLKGIERFRREKKGDTFRGWLWTITRNKIADRWRAKAAGANAAGGTTMKNVLDQVPENLAEQTVSVSAEDDRTMVIRRALEMIKVEFRANSWQAFWMTTVEQKPAADVAESLGMKVGAIYTAKSRVLSRLREELAGLEEQLLN